MGNRMIMMMIEIERREGFLLLQPKILMKPLGRSSLHHGSIDN
jgi:hypothetical protein